MRTEVRIVLGLLAVACISTSILGLLTSADAQTHTMPGANVVPSGASLTINSGASITAAAGSTVTGFGAPNTSGTSILKGNGSGGFSNAAAGTDYAAPTSGSSILYGNGSGGFSNVTVGTGLSFTTGTLTATGGAPAGADTNVQYKDGTVFGGDANFTWNKTTPKLTLSGSASSDSRLKIGTIEIQPLALNNSWIGENTYYDGSLFKYRATGSAGLFRFLGTEGQIAFYASGSAGGSLPSSNAQLKVNSDGSVALGGGITSTAGNYTNSQMLIKSATPRTTVPANSVVGWSNTNGDASTTVDTGLARNTAGVVEVDNGTAGTFGDIKVDEVNAVTGFQVNGAAASGKILQGNATDFVASTPAWPTASGAVGYTIRSTATNFASYPAQLVNSSVSAQSPSTSDVYLAGSAIVVTAGDFKVGGQYKCVFDMTKSAGTGAIVITLRVGTGTGAVGDAAIQTYTFGAGTSVADFGMFEVVATWRTVGSGTSAVIQGMCRGTHQLATTGLFNNAAGWMVLGSPSPSSGFNSSTGTVIGLSFNGSTAFAGTTQVVQAQLQQ